MVGTPVLRFDGGAPPPLNSIKLPSRLNIIWGCEERGGTHVGSVVQRSGGKVPRNLGNEAKSFLHDAVA